MTQEIERLGCPFCGAQPQEYSGDSDFLECSNEDCDLHGVEIQEDYWQARARVGKGEVERRKAIAGLHGCRLAARGEYCASCVIQATNYEYQGEEDRRSKPHDYALSAKPVEVGELAKVVYGHHTMYPQDAESIAQAILNKYDVREK
jgi:hypothetical protein